jgi:DNA-binding CsgD family transcriptional regulator
VRVVGRENESAWIDSLLDAVRIESRLVTIDAPAGSGKSAVLHAAAEQAAQAHATVLSCRPSAVEAQYGYAALGDLLAPIRSFEDIEPVPRRALERALLRTDGTEPLDPRAVGLGCLSVLQQLAALGPLVLLVDDVHWLDVPSADALTFALRRLPERGVLVLGARRSGEPGPTLPGDTVPLAPLSEPSMMTLLSQFTVGGERHLTTRELRSIVTAANGNPLFAIELARHAVRHPPSITGQLTVPSSLDAVIDLRFDDASEPVIEALAIVALLAKPRTTDLGPLGIAAPIELAERDGIVGTADGRVQFLHPLYAAAVLQRTTASVRRRLHARIAAATTDAAARLWHSALAADRPDPALAEQLAEHAVVLVALGAGDQAAEFAVLAANLTALDAPERHERFVTAARLSFQRGEADLAREMLAEAAQSTPTPAGKVREQLVRATVEFSLGSSEGARRHAVDALAHCTTDAERVEVHSILARVSYDNFDESTRQATIAMELAERCEVPPLVLAQVLAARAGEAFMAGHGLDRAMFERAIDLERDAIQFSANSAYSSFAVLLKIADEFDESRTMLLSVLQHNDDDGALPFALSHLPQLELWTGNWDAAEEYGQRHLEAALRTGQQDQVQQARNNLAQIEIYRGEAGHASVWAESLRHNGRESGDTWTERNGLGLLGVIAMAEGHAERAVTILQRWRELSEQMALRDPGYRRMEGDLVEALVATGRLDEAATNAAAMQQIANRLGRPTLLAGAARARALVAAANGNRAGAVSLAQAAVDGYAATPMVVEHARSLLTLGQIHRRFKEKAPARAALEQALVVFDRLGAERLAERTRQDLARVGLRTSGGTALTETELRVARLAATGRTVRQVGDELFISPKTVEANLTRVYRKLGLSGRAELATWAATVDGRTG